MALPNFVVGLRRNCSSVPVKSRNLIVMCCGFEGSASSSFSGCAPGTSLPFSSTSAAVGGW